MKNERGKQDGGHTTVLRELKDDPMGEEGAHLFLLGSRAKAIP